jgi:hypothetical protein
MAILRQYVQYAQCKLFPNNTTASDYSLSHFIVILLSFEQPSARKTGKKQSMYPTLYITASCRTVYSKSSPALLAVPARLRRCITIHTSEAFVSPYYSNTTCFGPTRCHHQNSYTQHQRKTNTTKHTPDPKHAHTIK